MEFMPHSKPSTCWAENKNFLRQDEVVYNLIIGIIQGLIRLEEKATLASDIFIGAVRGKATGQTMLVSLMTPPRDLLIAQKTLLPQPLDLLIAYLLEHEINIPGVLAPTAVARHFISRWQESKKVSALLFRRERIHKLTRCRDIALAAGNFVPAAAADDELAAEWIFEFNREIGEPISRETAHKIAAGKIAKGSLLFWRDPEPVAMCAQEKESENGAIINLVYTPPQHRNKGYATSCVLRLCRKILGEGKSYCSLYTDLGNPISNHIYAQIGFEPVLDLEHYRFQAAP